MDEQEERPERGCEECGSPVIVQPSTGSKACSNKDCRFAHGFPLSAAQFRREFYCEWVPSECSVQSKGGG